MKPLSEVLEKMRQRDLLLKDLYGMSDEEIGEVGELANDIDEMFKKMFDGELCCTEVSISLIEEIGVDLTSETVYKMTLIILVLMNGLKARKVVAKKQPKSMMGKSRIPPGFGS